LLSKLVVRRLHAHGEIDLPDLGVTFDDGAELVLGERPLFARVEDEGEVARHARKVRPFGQRDHDRETALHVARPGPVTSVAVDARRAVLRPDRVEMTDERHVRPAPPAGDRHDD